MVQNKSDGKKYMNEIKKDQEQNLNNKNIYDNVKEENFVKNVEEVVVVKTIEGSSMKKEDPKEKYRSFKAFSRVSSIIYSFIVTVLMGIILGYFFDKWFAGDNWMLIMIVTFVFIATFNLYRGLLRLK